MTRVKLLKRRCLTQSGDLLVCEIDAQMNPVNNVAKEVWKKAGKQLLEFRTTNVNLPLAECSLVTTPSFKLDPRYRAIAHVVVPVFANPDSLTMEDRAKLKDCYDTLFAKAQDEKRKKMVLPFLGKVRETKKKEVRSADAVEIAFTSAFEAAQSGKMEAVEEINFTTMISKVASTAKANTLYKNRKATNDQPKTCARDCSIGKSGTLPDWKKKCSGELVSLLSIIDKMKGDFRSSDLFGCSNAADLIMCRIGKFDVDWDSEEAAEYEICAQHLNMYLLNWKSPFWKNFKVEDGNNLCSFPDHQGTPPVLPNNRTSFVTKADSKRWMAKKGSILKVGTPICEDDMRFLCGSEFDVKLTKSAARSPKSTLTKSTVSPEVEEAFKKLFIALKINANVDRRVNYNRLSDRQQRRKARLARIVISALVEVLAPDAQDELRKRVFGGEQISPKDHCEPMRKMLTDAANLWERADSKIHRLFVLSTVAKAPLPMLQQFFHGLTAYFHKKARTVYVKGTVDAPQRIVRVRYVTPELDKLIEFILSPLVVLNLPFDERNEKMDDGSTASMPNLVRLQTIDEVYRMYLAWLEEEGLSHLALKPTTAKFIIKLLAPKRRTNLTCVDEKIADGMHAFDQLFDTVTELLRKGYIDKETADKLNKGLQSGMAYLRGDFKVHVKLHSECADHCATFALSDSNSPCFAEVCDHKHDSVCDRCSSLDATLELIRDLLESAENAAKNAEKAHFEMRKEECEIQCEAIYQMKYHQIRASLSHNEKSEFVEKLQDSPGCALVTLDWAQKLTPLYAREKQVEYYAKAGIAYHMCHAETVIDGEPAEHLSVHIFNPGEKQDGPAVFLIIEAFLKELKQMGITRVLIRSDCAGCYRNASLIFSLFNLQKKLGMTIEGLMFSEAQAGKGPCDRGSARTKGKARDHVTSTRGKIETKEEFFKALTDGKLLNGVSVNLCTISGKKNVSATIANITSYSSFEFEDDGIRVRRHRSIGKGLLHANLKSTPSAGSLKIEEEGGHTVKKDDLFWLTRTSHQSRTPKTVKIESQNKSSGMLCCTEEGCIKEFRSPHMLGRHISSEKHKYEVERKTLHDYCTEMASLSIGVNMTKGSFDHAVSASIHDQPTTLKQGFALRTTKQRNPDDQPARALIRQFFEDKRKANVKCDPHEAFMFMWNARDNNGSALIKPKNRLTKTQVKSVINGLLKKVQKEQDAQPSSSTIKKSKNTPVEDISEESSDEDDDDKEEEDLEYLRTAEDDEVFCRNLLIENRDKIFEDEEVIDDNLEKKSTRKRRSVQYN